MKEWSASLELGRGTIWEMELMLELMENDSDAGLCNVVDDDVHTFGNHRWNKWALESSALQGPLRVA